MQTKSYISNPYARVFGLSRTVLCFLALALICCGTGFGQSFTISPGVTGLTIHPGDQNVPLTVNLAAGTYAGPVTVTLTGLPSGITVTPVTLTPGSSGTVALSASVAADQEAFPPVSPFPPDISTKTVTVLAFAGSLSSSANLSLTVSLENPSYTPSPAQINLPIVNINTSGTPIVNKTTNVPGTVTITSADGQTSYLPSGSDADNTAVFHLHGNSTLAMPKKAYHIKLNTSDDLLTSMGLTCPYLTSSGKAVCDKSKSFILLANYDDKTFLRDWSAFALANAIPSGGAYLSYTAGSPSPTGTSTPGWWAPHSLFVELFLNGVYQGNYQLTEEVKVDSHRVNLTEMAESDTSGDALTGGYLVEIDKRADEDFVWKTPQGLSLGLLDPDYVPEVPEQTSYTQTYTNTAENALFSSSYQDPTQGWRAYFDQAAAVNFYIVNDLMGNVDGGDFFSSDYLYKQRDNPLLYMGPVWDFDVSSGNVNYYTIADPTMPWMQTQAIWYKQWFTDPSFKAAVVQQWNALKNGGNFDAWLASINQEAASLQQSQANNFGRWPMQGITVWPNSEAAGSYNGEVSFLTSWLSTRMGYLDAQFNAKARTSTTLAVPQGTLRAGVSANVSVKVAGGSAPTGVVTLFAGSAIAGTASLDGTETATVAASLPAGTYVLRATYNGDKSNALSSGTTKVTVLPALISSAVNLSTSATDVTAATSVTLNAAVAGSGSATPSGQVQFMANGVNLGSATLSSGLASLTTPLPAGTNVVVARYLGDTNYVASASNALSVAVQQNSVQVGFATNPAGVPYQVDGQSYTAAQTLTLAVGSTHTISTASQTSGGQQLAFVSWSDGGAASHTITVPSSATTYTASFATSYLLSAAANPTAGGMFTLTPALATGYYPAGSTVGLSAIPNSGYVFAGWTGNVASATAPATSIVLSSPQAITANFALANILINDNHGFAPGSMILNGSALLAGTALQLTNGGEYQAASAYSPKVVNIQKFITDFTFQATNANADGFTFVLQDQGPKAVGAYGVDLGYGSGTGGVQNSVAIKFDLYNNFGEGADSTGIYLRGARPTTPSVDLTSTGVNLHSGNVFAVHMIYDGYSLRVTLTDTITMASTTQTYIVNIPSIVGASTAYVGFTAGTGSVTATQDILSWQYSQAR